MRGKECDSVQKQLNKLYIKMKQAILSNRKAEYIGTNMVGAILMVGK